MKPFTPILISLLCFLAGVLVGAQLWVPLLVALLAPLAWKAWGKGRRNHPRQNLPP
ncbi:hypothetical protein OpiT1DRAFT_00789 [Opitutaceae bacterium TAV1]|nr:hypothetical protein OpiT1DRAFT_00789 [Opitutaceae bacterium TAV1]